MNQQSDDLGGTSEEGVKTVELFKKYPIGGLGMGFDKDMRASVEKIEEPEQIKLGATHPVEPEFSSLFADTKNGKNADTAASNEE